MDNTFDKMYYQEGDLLGGLDETGVSDIAGPLVAACVILPKIDIRKNSLKIFEVNESKQIPEKYRKGHAETIWQCATAIGIGEVSPSEIDYLGKHTATNVAMLRAIAACRNTKGKHILPDYLLIDGQYVLQTGIRQQNIQEGDTKSLSIASASIVAKVYRDQIMINLHERYPCYDWINNKGYPCENQFRGLDEHGAQINIHRIKFWPFVPNPKFPETDPRWKKRRQIWKIKTEIQLGRELGDDVWTLKPQFSNLSKRSRALLSQEAEIGNI